MIAQRKPTQPLDIYGILGNNLNGQKMGELININPKYYKDNITSAIKKI